MATEIDLESALRGHFALDPATKVEVTMWLNNEGRLVAKLGAEPESLEFVVFGNNVCQYPPSKPPTQRAVVSEGINDGGMGRV